MHHNEAVLKNIQPRQVLAADRGSAKALFRRGRARRLLGQSEAALSDLQAAIALAPNDAAIAKELQARSAGPSCLYLNFK